MIARRRLLFYCQHSVGLGHLVRSFALCRALTERFEVHLLCGGALPEAIEVPPGVRLVALPAVGVGADGVFASHDPGLTVERAWELRRALLVRTLHEVRPDVLLVELFPFGRKQFAVELVPLLQEAWSMGARRPLVACSLRDILVRKRSDQARFDERAARVANDFYDAILMHAERRLAPLEESFRPATPLRVPVHYTGYVVPNGHAERASATDREHRVVVSAGGGLVGEPLLQAALGAHRILWPTERLATTLVGGPFLPEPAWERLREGARGLEGVTLRRAVPDLADELATAAASVSQCGYNTTLEVLRAGLPALVVPYATPSEDEQTRRAAGLAARGALRMLDPEALSPETLAGALRDLLRFRPDPMEIDLDGAPRSTALLERLADEHHAEPEAA
jgi:predicted glycosyltransferase